MKKILSLLALVLMSCMGAWAQTTVVARMSDLVGAGTNHDAVVSNLWKASEGDVYEFSNNHYIGGIANDDIKTALGSKYVTVAAWVYGRPNGGCIFCYGDQGTGIKFKLTGTTMQTTTKSKVDYASQNVDAIAADQWNLVAFTINPGFSSTRYISGHQGNFNYFYTKNATAGMNTPVEAGQFFAIASGNQGDEREPFTGLLANVTVIASDGWLGANDLVSDLVGAAPSPTGRDVNVTYRINGNDNDKFTKTVLLPYNDESWLTKVAVDFYTNATSTTSVITADTENVTVDVTPAFPFQEGKLYTMKAANSNNFVYTGTYAYKAGSDHLFEGNDIWQFEHVANTPNLYKVKNFHAGYATVANSENQTLVTFSETATEWSEGNGATSYFRITKNGNGFNLQHPGVANANAGNHVGGKLGLWNNGNSPGDNGSRMSVTEVTLDNLKASSCDYVADVVTKLPILYTTDVKETAATAINSATTFKGVYAAVNAFHATANGKSISFKNVARRGTGSYLAAPSNGNLKTETSFGYTTVWNLQHVKGATYRLYNAQTERYVGVMPASDSQQIPTVTAVGQAGAYELQTTATANLVNIKFENDRDREYIHENGTNVPVVWGPSNEAKEASCWTVELVNLGDLVALDAQQLLTDNASNHSATPALGQYPDATYTALSAAYNTYTASKTDDNLAALQQAMKEFANSSVKAVYVIENNNPTYGVGKAIINDNNDGQPHFALIDNLDDRMLWVVNTTAEEMTAGTYTIANFHSGRGLWGSETIEVAPTTDEEQVEGQFLIKQGGNVRHAQESGSWLVTWNYTTTANSASAWTFNYVGTDVELKAFAEKFEQYHDFVSAIANARNSVNGVTIGTALGQYSGTNTEVVNGKISTATALTDGKTIETVDMTALIAASEEVTAEAAKLALNMPTAGSFLRLKGGVSSKYADANAQADQTNRAARIGMSEDGEGAGSVWYLDENNRLISFSKGYFVKETCDHSGTADNASVLSFRASDRTKGRYGIYNGNARLYDNGAPANRNCLDRQGGAANETENWILEEVESLPVSISAAKYATLYAPVALTIPTDVTAYTLTVEGDYLKATAVEGTIPANTGVVLAAEEGTYNFAITTSETFAGQNVLTGTVPTIAKDDNALVLGKKDDQIGFYGVKDDVANLAGFKAYYVPTAGESNLRIVFDNEVLTSIITAAQENGGQAIYDLQGRRVVKTQNGLNIINGKKVIK